MALPIPKGPVQVKRGTSAQWAQAEAQGIILLNGELGYDDDLDVFRVGDGVSPWSQLKDPTAGFIAEATAALDAGVLQTQQVLADGTAQAEALIQQAAGTIDQKLAGGPLTVGLKTDTGPDFSVSFDDGQPFVTATEQDGITSKVKQLAGLSASGARLEELTADTGFAFAVVYENPANGVWNLQWGVKDDGTLYQPGSPIGTVNSDIVWPGDSLSAGAGGAGTTAPGTLQSLLTTAGKPGTVRNFGVGGETSSDIAARYAGGTMLVMPSGGVIPASGGVTVAITNDDKLVTGSFIRQGSTGLNPCTVGGIVGSITWDSTAGTYTFTRTVAGSAVTFLKPQPIIPAASQTRKNDLLVMWPGRNNATATARVLSDIATMIEHQDASVGKWLVLGVTNGANEGTGTGVYNAITSLNATEKQLYGRRHIDVRRYLIDYGLTDAGITPTTQDQADIAADIPPTSLRSDAIHFNATGYSLIGKLVYDRLVEMGWI